MPPLEVVKPEYCDEEILCMDGGRRAFGRLYQISSSLGAIAIDKKIGRPFLVLQVCFSNARKWMARKFYVEGGEGTSIWG